MLLLANGAFKSGSTWMREIVIRIRPFAPIPEAWGQKSLSHWIDPPKIAAFLREVDCENTDYLSKSHIFDRAMVKLLLASPQVRVLDITRDVKDSIVSHYYHLIRERRIPEGFVPYYWKIGRYKAYELRLYHQVWRIDSPNIYTSSFERLKLDFHNEVRALGAFLQVDLSDDQLDELQDATTLKKLQANTGEEEKSEKERFFRKGEIGDWENHFGAAERDDVERVYRDGLPVYGRLRYGAQFTARRRVKRMLGLT